MARRKRQKTPERKSAKGQVPLLTVVSLAWVLLLGGFLAGVYVYAAEVWPYPVMKEIRDYVLGHREETTSLGQKLKNDLDLVPYRNITTLRKLAKFTVNPRAREITGLPIKPRRENPKIYLSEDAPKGYRVIFGTFDFEESRNGAILINPEGEVINYWNVTQGYIPWPHESDENTWPTGYDIAPDGSIVATFDGSTALIKYDYCGKPVWKTFGGFHHSVDLDDKGALWAWGNEGRVRGGMVSTYGRYMVKVDYKTGRIIKLFHLSEVMEANPGIDIFAILQLDQHHGQEEQEMSYWISNDPGVYWHVNDIEALPEDLAKYYPQFEAGDLLSSLRALDLVFVVDPDTLRVKWWRQGLTRRQHDPDWNSEGTITIFDNNMHRSYSRIVEIDPKTMEHRTLVDGSKYEFYSRMRGKHQYLGNGAVLVTSSQQGRVFELNAKGEVVFEFLNSYDDPEKPGEPRQYLGISEAKFLPMDFFKELPECG